MTSDYERDLRERREFETARVQATAAFADTLAHRCRRHRTDPGEPCWPGPRAVCGDRARDAGYRPEDGPRRRRRTRL